MHARGMCITAGASYCVQRPPSPCHGRVALPNELEGAPDHEIAEVVLPRLPLTAMHMLSQFAGEDGRSPTVPARRR